MKCYCGYESVVIVDNEPLCEECSEMPTTAGHCVVCGAHRLAQNLMILNGKDVCDTENCYNAFYHNKFIGIL